MVAVCSRRGGLVKGNARRKGGNGRALSELFEALLLSRRTPELDGHIDAKSPTPCRW